MVVIIQEHYSFDNSVGSGWLNYYESDTNIIRIKSAVCRMLGYESDSERISHSSKWNHLYQIYAKILKCFCIVLLLLKCAFCTGVGTGVTGGQGHPSHSSYMLHYILNLLNKSQFRLEAVTKAKKLVAST